jgi:aminopeptidase 2
MTRRQFPPRAFDASLTSIDSVVDKLTSSFKLDADGKLDDTAYPSDLERIVFVNAVKNGGRQEWEALKAIYDNPRTPTQKISACLAMTRAQQDDLIKETFEYMECAKDQDYM